MSDMPDMFDPQSQFDAGMWLKAAQAAVRAYCGWHVCPQLKRTITVDSYGGRTLLLPTQHVVDVTNVTVNGVDCTHDVQWSEAGILRLNSGMFPDGLRDVEVSLTDGYDPADVPQVMALLVTLAKRAQIQPGIASQSVNGASISYATAATPGVALLQSEKDLLAPYCLEARP